MNPNIIGVRFTRIGKIYHFDTSAVPDVSLGEHVIVDTARGKHLGEVVQVVKETPPQPEGGWRSVERRATPRDLLLLQSWQSKQTEAMINCRARAAELKLDGVKIVAAEYNYDGSRLAFLFSTESEEKVDLKSLKRDMQNIYPTAHIEMRQIGPRDVAKIIGGMGACGIETRCCSKFLTDFSPISIKMAKEQGISLTPEEITGMCGRLRCCLIYEYEQYVEARKTLPKRNKRVVTPKGEGKVVDVLPMSNKIMVFIETEEKRFMETFNREEVEPWDELEALRRKSEAPCDRHDSGGCTCGKSSPLEDSREDNPAISSTAETRENKENNAPRRDNRENSGGNPPRRENRENKPGNPPRRENRENKPGNPPRQENRENKGDNAPRRENPNQRRDNRRN